ncbi:MAG: fructosamine kinase family protein [Woeseiaceae bacterium]|nr:fructosamine kinase family protein [Woeseiaceae bacterium]
MPDWPAIADCLQQNGLSTRQFRTPTPVSGGDINDAWRIETNGKTLFLKTGPTTAADMFAAEAEGLAEIAAANAVRVPAVIACGETARDAFIALEWIELSAPTAASDAMLGTQLAAMHRVTAKRFGWKRNNTIGSTPQMNAWSASWPDFYREQRLGYQLRLAASNGCSGKITSLGEQLVQSLDALFDNYEPVPSLLHGDLWGGNRASAAGEPVIFDPAVYYGDRESDLAMTQLFGRFSSDFYSAYESAWPTAPGYSERVPLYQLYHLLNHLNLFGGSYESSVERTLNSLCSVCR